MLQSIRRHTLALSILLLAIISVSIVMYCRFTSVSSPAKSQFWLSLLILVYGIYLLTVSQHYMNHLQRCDLETHTKQQRKDIQSAYYRGRLPNDTTLNSVAQEHAQKQRALLRYHIVFFAIWALGALLVYSSVSAFLHPNEHSLLKHWSSFGSFYIILVTINLYKMTHRIISNAKILSDPKTSNEPPIGDTRWWTGRW